MLTSHLLRPLLLFAVIATLFEFTTIDLWLADHLFHWSGDSWSWRRAWITEQLIHQGGRDLVGAMLLALALALVASYGQTRVRPWRSALWYLLGSYLVSVVAVSLMKQLTHVNCPWDLLRYGGQFDYVRTFMNYAHAGDVGECFPAGHASAAYGWFGLYYIAREYWPQWRFRVLGTVIAMGVIYGVGQQLRGAHFLSHDVWTVGICWLGATTLALRWFPDGKPKAMTREVAAA
jgi:membrane-associated PAP2 superfamily phosphatase